MRRREFLEALATTTAALSLTQFETILAASGFHVKDGYSGPLLTSYVSSTCGACPGGCGIRVRKIDDVPVKIDGNPIHPVNRGGLCPVGAASLAFLSHPDRIKQPLLRTGPRGSGEYRPATWDEAEQMVVEKLSEIKNAKQPERLLFYDARKDGPGLDLARKLVADFGSPNFYDSFDHNPTIASSVWGGEGTAFAYDLENARDIFCFGYPVFESDRNPVYYAGLRNRLLDMPEGERGRFIIIDPRLSASAAKAERWVPIRPNTFGLLALGMLYLIIKERLYNSEAVEKHCVGFEDRTDSRGRTTEGFKSFVLKNYYPSYVSDRTGVPVDQIIALARSFAERPKAIAIAGKSAGRTVDGVYQVWAIMALNAVTGRFGSDGGIRGKGLYPLKRPSIKKLSVKPLVNPSLEGTPYLTGIGSVELLPDKILSETPYPIKVAIFNGVNPVYDSVQSNRFRQAMQNIPFSVMFATLHNEMTALADLVLPDCSFLEKNDLVLPDSDFSYPVVSLAQPVMAPLYDSRQADDVIISLGKKINGSEWNKWDNYKSHLEERIRDLYESNAGTLFSDQFLVSFEALLAERGWRRQEHRDANDFKKQFTVTGGWWNPLRLQDVKHERFPTAAGKFYLISAPLRKKFKASQHSLNDLMEMAGLKVGDEPDHILGAYRNYEHEEASQFPLEMYPVELTPFRGDGSRLKEMADMGEYTQNVKWRSWVELNPETAHELGLTDRKDVWIESAHGKQQVLLVMNPGLVPGVAAVPSNLGREGNYRFGENVNSILSNTRDFLTGLPARTETKIKIYAVT